MRTDDELATETKRVIARIEQITVETHDVERLLDFYRRHLGAESSPASEDADGVGARVVDFCGVRLELIKRPTDRETVDDRRPPGFVQLGFALGSADAVDELTARLLAAGHRVLQPPSRSCAGGCYESIVLDPDGNRLKLAV